ncbi:MAG: alanine racemase, partial [Ilumatobacteraceae bacterium]
MTLTLTVDAAVWNRHVDTLAALVPGLVPVVKGNGYGFGRAFLAERAATLSPLMAVGTIHEVSDVPSNYTAVVLTPALDIPFPLR